MKRHIIALITLVFTTTATLSAQICTATKQHADYSPIGSGTNASVTAHISAVGDLVTISAWCYPSCTPTTVTLGSQTAVKTTVSGNPGPGSPGTGQAFIFYVLSANASGNQTLNFTATGGAAQTQVAYIDFSPSAGCVFSHHTDSVVGSGTGGTANTPSITPTAGDLLYNFTWVTEHVTAVNSPWSCPVYNLPGESQNCFMDVTQNAAGYILSAPSGSTANNMTLIHSGDSWQALITSFSIAPNGQAPKSPTNLHATVQ